MSNRQQNEARVNKNDDFYTIYEDVVKEMEHYKAEFVGKTIYCPCDNPKWSSFVRYFRDNFDELHLRRLIVTHWGSKEVHEWFCNAGHTVHEMGPNNRGIFTEEPNGSFDDDYCLSLLEEADIVVTNPPFSKWRKFVLTLLDYKKKFLILGPLANFVYNEFNKEIKNREIHLGFNKIEDFCLPDWFPMKGKREYLADEELIPGTGWRRGVNIPMVHVVWYTNLETEPEREWLTTGVKFKEGNYYRYVNYPEAINIDRAKDIPDDYEGLMGVPVSFMDRMNPNQFKIVSIKHGKEARSKEFDDAYELTGKHANASWNLGYWDGEGNAIIPYSRVIIKRINNEGE